MSEVNGPDVDAMNSFEHPRAVDVREHRLAASGRRLEHGFAAHSITILRLRLGASQRFAADSTVPRRRRAPALDLRGTGGGRVTDWSCRCRRRRCPPAMIAGVRAVLLVVVHGLGRASVERARPTQARMAARWPTRIISL